MKYYEFINNAIVDRCFDELGDELSTFAIARFIDEKLLNHMDWLFKENQRLKKEIERYKEHISTWRWCARRSVAENAEIIKENEKLKRQIKRLKGKK